MTKRRVTAAVGLLGLALLLACSSTRRIAAEGDGAPPPLPGAETSSGGDAAAGEVVTAPACPASPAAPDESWYRSAVFYEIYVRSFHDGDGDGVGDLAGLTAKLDYLNDGDPATDDDLGVTALWLMPVTDARSDHGYDTVDYRAIDPDYGDLDDLEALLAAAGARGIRVIMDLVLNHSSSAHPWFVDAASGADAPRRGWYVWSPEPKDWDRPWGGGPTWHRRGEAWYYGLFSEGMPDLDYAEEVVRREALEISRFWLGRGLDGFRLDAVRYLIETGGGAGQMDTPETHAFWRWYRDQLSGDYPDAVLVGEAWTERKNVAPYFGETAEPELHMAFDFDLQAALLGGLDNDVPVAVRHALCGVARDYPAHAANGIFLSNHDLVRAASELGRDPEKMRLAAALLLTLRGTPYLYYGEEIGQPNGVTLGDEAKREAMRWDASAGGAGTSLPDVASQTDDPDSLLGHYRRLIRLRQARPALALGRSEVIPAEQVSDPAVLALLRRHAGETLLVLHHFGATDASELRVELAGRELLPAGAAATTTLWGEGTASISGSAVTVATLPARGSLVLALTP